MSRPWIKQPVSKLNDARLSFVSDQAQRDYFMLYLLAGQLDADGLFIDNGRRLPDKEIAFRIHIDLTRFKKTIKELQSENLIHVNGKGPAIMDWGNEQINWREKQEQTRERVTRYRENVARDSEAVARDGDNVTLLDKKKTRPEEDKKKTRPTPTPSATSPTSGRKAGKKDDEKKNSSLLFQNLKGKQRKRADQAIKILGSLGIRNPKLETTAAILATRHYKNDEQMFNEMFAAIASSYADPTVRSKEAVAINRIETGKIPQSFIEDRTLWRSVPVKTLELAGIDIHKNDKYQKSLNTLRERGLVE